MVPIAPQVHLRREQRLHEPLPGIPQWTVCVCTAHEAPACTCPSFPVAPLYTSSNRRYLRRDWVLQTRKVDRFCLIISHRPHEIVKLLTQITNRIFLKENVNRLWPAQISNCFHRFAFGNCI